MNKYEINNENFFDFSTDCFLMLTSKSNYPNNLNYIFNEINLDMKNISRINQIHSSKIVFAKSSGSFGNADGLISHKNNNNILSIVTADCMPIFMYDNNSGFFGLFHAGWKGIVKGIHKKAIIDFNNLGVLTENIHIVFGPFIKSCCYEIKEDIINHFNKKFTKFIDDKIFLNLSNLVVTDLRNLGIKKDNISLNKICTFENEDCHSYRRDGGKLDRMFSLICYKI